jgi:hypothetical protein
MTNPTFEVNWPTITFRCGCGQKLYTLSTNILAYWNDFKCPKCGQKYTSRNSLIAVVVPAKSAQIHTTRKRVEHGGKKVERTPYPTLSKKPRK